MKSILTSIKKLLGPDEEHDHFDTDIIMHINTVFMILKQLGVGPDKGFRIEDSSAEWDDFLPDNDEQLEGVKSFMFLKVKLVFDPPLSSVILEAMKRSSDELEWRLTNN